MNSEDLTQRHRSTLSQDFPPLPQSPSLNGNIIDQALSESSDDNFLEEYPASPRGKKS